MKFWLCLNFELPQSLLDHARNAEALGFEGVVLPEHVVVKEGERTPHPNGYPLKAHELFLDPFLAFAAMAAVTTRLRFLNGVYVVPLRDPFSLAKQAGSLAVMSNDRFVLGTGVGWLKEEFDTMGRDFATRGRRMDEMLAILRDFWDDGYAEFHGEHFEFSRSGMFPVPRRQIPIWIGGHSMAAARRAANYDGYMPMRAVTDPMAPLNETSRAEFVLIDELRRARGHTGPFARMVSAFGVEDPGMARKLEEVDGITDLLITPWTMSDYTQSYEEKRSLTARFAERMIHHPA
jgi:probable F420-dependent oxidoreductase